VQVLQADERLAMLWERCKAAQVGVGLGAAGHAARCADQGRSGGTGLSSAAGALSRVVPLPRRAVGAMQERTQSAR